MSTEAPTDVTPATPARPQFVLILQDSENGQAIEMAGAQHPVEFNPSSPAHVIGAWFRDNIELLSKVALSQGKAAPELIGERTPLLLSSDSQAVSS